MSFWTNKKVIVTGGAGFLGGYVCEILREHGAKLNVIRRNEYDLRMPSSCRWVFDDFQDAEIVIHLADNVGGIATTAAKPASSFYDNAMMGINMIHAAHCARVEKFVCVGSVCAYPEVTLVPTSEDNLWAGYPEPTNAPYGVAKRIIHTMLDAYHKEYGMKSAYLLMANLYGPGDDFDAQTSHVIPALIKKCIDAKQQGLEGISVWGSGNVSRDFLYVKDAAEAVVLAAEKVETPEPINIATGYETYISSLVEAIKQTVGFAGRTAFDRSQPDGQRRRVFDVSKAHQLLGWKATTDIYDGLRETVEWYLENKNDLS